MKKAFPVLIFLALLAGTAIFYRYHRIADLRPQGIHQWRQSDGASLALNYHQHSLSFFEPETHNLTSANGTSGKCATSEVPILYFSVSVLYHLFGTDESLYRLLNTLLFFIGLFFLFRLVRYLTHSIFWSVSLAMLFFASPVLAYYANNFLSNSGALSFAISGLFFFVVYQREKRHSSFLTAMFFFGLAGCFKVSSLMVFFAAALVMLPEAIRNRNKAIPRPGKIIPFTLVPLIPVLWILYARHYNEVNGCTYFSTTIFPVWDIPSGEFRRVINGIFDQWFYDYFHPSAYLFFGLLTAFLIVFYKKVPAPFGWLLIATGLQVVLYILLQFWTLADHDYYTIDLYIFPVILVVAAAGMASVHFPKILTAKLLKTLFLVFLAFNIYHTGTQLKERYSGAGSVIYNETDVADRLEIGFSDTIVSLPDNSHVSLYLLNRKGWTEYADMKLGRDTPVTYNRDSTGLAASIRKGAKYLIVHDQEYFLGRSWLEPYTRHLHKRYGNVFAFDLRDTVMNFNYLPELSDSLHYDFEETADLTYVDSMQSRSGKFSVKLSKKGNEFGPTVGFDSLRSGEGFEVTAWMRGEAEGRIVASADQSFYKSENRREDTDGEWQKISLRFFVPENLQGKSLKIYLYNPEEDPVWFDDFTILRLHPVQ